MLLQRAAAKASKDWQLVNDGNGEQTIQCCHSKYKVTYFDRKGTIRLNPKGMQQKYIYDIRNEDAIISILMDLESAYDNAYAGEAKKTVVAVFDSNKQEALIELGIAEKYIKQALERLKNDPAIQSIHAKLKNYLDHAD